MQLGAARAELACVRGRQAEAEEREDRVKVLLASARSEAGFKVSCFGVCLWRGWGGVTSFGVCGASRRMGGV